MGILDSVHTWCLGTVPEYVYRWALMWTPPLSRTHARIRARSRCPSTRSRLYTRAQKWALGPTVYRFFFSSGVVHCFVFAATGHHDTKWSLTRQNEVTIYVLSYISGTKSVDILIRCPGTGSRAPTVWTAPLYQQLTGLTFAGGEN